MKKIFLLFILLGCQARVVGQRNLMAFFDRGIYFDNGSPTIDKITSKVKIREEVKVDFYKHFRGEGKYKFTFYKLSYVTQVNSLTGLFSGKLYRVGHHRDEIFFKISIYVPDYFNNEPSLMNEINEREGNQVSINWKGEILPLIVEQRNDSIDLPSFLGIDEKNVIQHYLLYPNVNPERKTHFYMFVSNHKFIGIEIKTLYCPSKELPNILKIKRDFIERRAYVQTKILGDKGYYYGIIPYMELKLVPEK